MGQQGREWGLLLARELNMRSLGADPESAHPVAAGEAVGLDALCVATGLTWLISERMVCTLEGGQVLDPYTDEALTLTDQGMQVLIDNPIT